MPALVRAALLLLALLAAPLPGRAAELVLAPGQALTQADVETLVRSGLGIAGDDRAVAVTLFRPALPLPNRAAAPIRVVLADLAPAQGSGRFGGRLVASLAGGGTTAIEVAGETTVLVPAAVLLRAEARGAGVAGTDCELRYLPERDVPSDALRMDQLDEGLVARRALPKGHVLRAGDLGRRPAVRKGDTVTVTYRSGALTMTQAAIAATAGGLGDGIGIRLTPDSSLRQAVIVGEGQVEVAAPGPAHDRVN